MAAPQPQATQTEVPSLTLTSLASTASDHTTQKLLALGMTQEAAEEKRKMFLSASARLVEEGLPPGSAARAFWVPGRVEIAGKHTDYAGGRSLLAATNKGFAVVSVDRDDSICRIFTTFGLKRERSSVELGISPELEPRQGHWSSYPATAIRRLAKNFGITRGVDIAVECDLPESSGMSTSSAVICYMWMVLAERNGIRNMEKFKSCISSDEELYAYLGFIENGQNCGPVLVGDRGVGTFGGSEDHTAIMSSEPGKIKMFSYCPTKHERTFDFPGDLVFVIAVSGAIAQKTGNAMADYNNAAFLARDAAAAWCKSTGELPLEGGIFVSGRPNLAEVVRHVRGTLGEAGESNDRVRQAVGEAIGKVDDGKGFGPHADDDTVRYKAGALKERFEQFFDESEVMTARIGEALSSGDDEQLGRWSDESHRQTVECLRNTVPETAWLPQEARRLGALGASAFGAGFGGSCWAVVRKRGAEAFAEEWGEAYRRKFPWCADASSFCTMTPGPGASQLH